MGLSAVLVIVVLILSPAPILAGRAAAEARAHWQGLIRVTGVLGLLLGLAVYLYSVNEAGALRALGVAVVAAVLVGAIPPALYFEAGYKWHAARAKLVGIWLLATVPLIAYVWAVLIFVSVFGVCVHRNGCLG